MGNPSGFPLDQALLGFLVQGPAHGYALHDRAEQELGRVWAMGMSNVYGTLKQLEEAGHVESTLDDETYPPRKVYSLLPSGRSRFLAWVRAPVPAIRDMRVEFLAKLFFFHTLGLKGLAGLLEGQRNACRQRLEELGRRGTGTEDWFERAVDGFRRHRIEATLDWLDALEGGWA